MFSDADLHISATSEESWGFFFLHNTIELACVSLNYTIVLP